MRITVNILYLTTITSVTDNDFFIIETANGPRKVRPSALGVRYTL